MDDRLGTRTVHNRKLGKQNMMRNLVQYFTLQDHDANERRHLLLLKIVLCYEDEDCVTIIVMDGCHAHPVPKEQKRNGKYCAFSW